MLRNLSTRARLALVALVAILTAAAGLLVANVANASGPVLSTTERGLCIKQGTGEPRSLWLVAATHKCPDPYWGPASLEDAFGIKLPAATDSRIVITSGSADVASLAAAEQKVIPVKVTGLPKYSATQARRVLVDVNGESFPNGVAVVGSPSLVTPANGDTSWTWNVTVKNGSAASATGFKLTLDVLAIPVS
jgi:hypothetical protein